MSRHHLTATILLLTVATMCPAAVFAQHDAAWKALGMPGRAHQSFARRIEHASDYAYDFGTHAEYHETTKPEHVKTVFMEMGRNLDAAKVHLDEMKKSAVNDEAAMKSIGKLEGHLATAQKLHKDVESELTAKFDKEKAMTASKRLSAELDAITTEHKALMKSLAAKAKPEAEAKK
jgi:hypothetical protein